MIMARACFRASELPVTTIDNNWNYLPGTPLYALKRGKVPPVQKWMVRKGELPGKCTQFIPQCSLLMISITSSAETQAD